MRSRCSAINPRRRGWRRFRLRRGDVSHALRLRGLSDPSPRFIARLQNHGRPHCRASQDQNLGLSRHRNPRCEAGQGHRRPREEPEDECREHAGLRRVFVAIGHVPNTQIFKPFINTDENGCIIRTEGAATNVPGVFVAGDCSDHVYRKPSRRRAWVARRPSRPNGCWRQRTLEGQPQLVAGSAIHYSPPWQLIVTAGFTSPDIAAWWEAPSGVSSKPRFNQLIGRTHAELGIDRSAAVTKFYAETKPEYVILAAASSAAFSPTTPTLPSSSTRICSAEQPHSRRVAERRQKLLFPRQLLHLSAHGAQPMNEDHLQRAARTDQPVVCHRQNRRHQDVSGVSPAVWLRLHQRHAHEYAGRTTTSI